MAIGILGRKVGMTQLYDSAGKCYAVTVIQAGPCDVLQVRTKERDGYEAIQLGFADKPRRLAARSERGHVVNLDSKRSKRRASAKLEPLPKADCEPKRFICEIRGENGKYTVGQKVTVNILDEIDGIFAATPPAETPPPAGGKKAKSAGTKPRHNFKAVDITGTSKGRGTAGVMKRHNFHGQRATHGVKKVHRHQGTTGCNTDPSHVFKGRKMAGHLGDERITTRNLKVFSVDPEKNLIMICGSVPGPRGAYLLIRETNKVGTAQTAAAAAKKK